MTSSRRLWIIVTKGELKKLELLLALALEN